MKLKLACADFTFPLLEHHKALKLIALLGFKGVDIGLFEKRSHLWPSKQFQNPTRSGKQLKRRLDDLGLKAADVFLQMTPGFAPYAINHPQAARRRKTRDWFSRTLDFAYACGSKHVTTLPGVRFADEPYRQSFGRSVDELAWRVELARSYKITFGFEAHVGSIVSKPELAEKLVKAVPRLPGAGATLTLDYTHFTQLGMPDSAVAPLLQYASHFHVRGARKGRLQASFKDNTINYKHVFNRLNKLSYKGWLGIEYVWIDWEHCNECDNLSETIQFRDLFKSIGVPLRGG